MFVIMLTGGAVGYGKSAWYSGMHKVKDEDIDGNTVMRDTVEYSENFAEAKRFPTEVEAFMFADKCLRGFWNNVHSTVMSIAGEGEKEPLLGNTVKKIMAVFEKHKLPEDLSLAIGPLISEYKMYMGEKSRYGGTLHKLDPYCGTGMTSIADFLWMLDNADFGWLSSGGMLCDSQDMLRAKDLFNKGMTSLRGMICNAISREMSFFKTKD